MKHAAASAFRFVLVMGIVNLFADMTYEGGGSIDGPFLGGLGASAAAIGIIAGLGEFLGYAVRVVAGYVADRTGKHWTITFVGYAINLLAVPALALCNGWIAAGALILTERIGRGIRKPTVEAMLSYTTGRHGKGWVYAVNTALDETGATLGPLLIALVLFQGGDYRTGFATLLISAGLALGALTVARITFPLPSRLETGRAALGKRFRPAYWLFMVAAACFAAGLMSFELVTFHLSGTGTIATPWIPALLALSTGFGVLASLVLGRLYDRVGLPVVLGAVAASALFAPLAFSGNVAAVVVAMLLWGIGYAAQDTLFKAIVAGLLPEGKRNLAFGLFYAGYGVGWLIGSIATGLLYDHSRVAMIAFCVGAQLVSLPLFILAGRRAPRAKQRNVDA
jgi:MFS family permease